MSALWIVPFALAADPTPPPSASADGPLQGDVAARSVALSIPGGSRRRRAVVDVYGPGGSHQTRSIVFRDGKAQIDDITVSSPQFVTIHSKREAYAGWLEPSNRERLKLDRIVLEPANYTLVDLDGLPVVGACRLGHIVLCTDMNGRASFSDGTIELPGGLTVRERMEVDGTRVIVPARRIEVDITGVLYRDPLHPIDNNEHADVVGRWLTVGTWTEELADEASVRRRSVEVTATSDPVVGAFEAAASVVLDFGETDALRTRVLPGAHLVRQTEAGIAVYPRLWPSTIAVEADFSVKDAVLTTITELRLDPGKTTHRVELTPPNPGTAVPKVVHGSEVVAKKRVMPPYPADAAASELGDVDCRVRVFIDEKGVPYQLQFEECPEPFRSEASEALMQWRWWPVKHEGRPVEAQFVMTIKFNAPSHRAGDP